MAKTNTNTNTSKSKSIDFYMKKYFDAKSMITFFDKHELLFQECVRLKNDVSFAEVKVLSKDPGSIFYDAESYNKYKTAVCDLTRKLLYCNTLASDAHEKGNEEVKAFVKEYIPLANIEICEDFIEGFWAACCLYARYREFERTKSFVKSINDLFDDTALERFCNDTFGDAEVIGVSEYVKRKRA